MALVTSRVGHAAQGRHGVDDAESISRLVKIHPVQIFTNADIVMPE